MADIQTNTMNISLEEYKGFTDEVSRANKLANTKEETIVSLKARISLLEERLSISEDKLREDRDYIYVLKLKSWMQEGNGPIKLSKNDPAIAEMINESYDAKVKELQQELDTAREKLAQMSKDSSKEYRELKETKNEEIKELNKQIKELKKDYEDLKLDKAAAIVEAERLEEINKLKEQLAEKDVDNVDSLEFFRKLMPWYIKPFSKFIYRYAHSGYLTLKNQKERAKIDTTSAFGKAKDYLKTLDVNKSASSYSNSSFFNHLIYGV